MMQGTRKTPDPVTKDKFQPFVRGALTEAMPLGEKSWFRCGGAADLVFNPADVADLQVFLKHCPPECPLTIVGGLANTIVRDGGVRGVVIRPAKEMSSVRAFGERYIRAETGALNGTVSAAAMKAGIGGLEFLSGIPGCIGGAAAMNAGAYGTEVKDVLIGIEGVTRTGEFKRLGVDDLDMRYRHTNLPDGFIVTAAIFKGVPEAYEVIKDRINTIKTKRNETQPIREQTGGSTFANPDVLSLRRSKLPEGTRAWQVVEMVDGRGLRFGGAQMSEQHCNFMINTGDATAADLENLGEELRARAMHRYGLNLRWEIKRIGEKT